MESCGPQVLMNTCNLPSAEDLLTLDVYEWNKMDVNEFKDDNMQPCVNDVNHNIMASVPTFDMNQCITTDASYGCYETTGYSYCSQDMSSYNSFQQEHLSGSYDRAYYNYSPHGSLGDNSSPDSSLNDNYNTDQNHNYALLQSQSWSPDGQFSDDSVELELTQLDDTPRIPTESYHPPFYAYRSKQADVLPHFEKVFPPKHQKSSKRGRPVTYLRRKSVNNSIYRSCSDDSDEDERFSTSPPSPSKCKRGAKNVLLWKFLLEELGKPMGNHVQWVDEKEGLFRFVDTAEVSKLWGQKKNKEDMNFEKLSRGIRHYYREGLMARQDGTRLVYRFNWDLVPKEYRRF